MKVAAVGVGASCTAYDLMKSPAMAICKTKARIMLLFCCSLEHEDGRNVKEAKRLHTPMCREQGYDDRTHDICTLYTYNILLRCYSRRHLADASPCQDGDGLTVM